MGLYSDIQQQMIKKPHTWLITGVAGFIGSNLLESLLFLNQKVVGMDDFSSGTQENLDSVFQKIPDKFQTNFKLVRGDIRLVEDCELAMEGVDYVLHHAAVASVPASIEFPEHTHAVNDAGFVNVLNVARKMGIKRLVYASSSAIYGNSPIAIKNESMTPEPVSPYAVSKLSNEFYAKSFNYCFGFETIGLRYFNIFGPRQNPRGAYASVVPLWIEAILTNNAINIFGDGYCVRDFCYINEVIQANILAALTTNADALNKTYNIGCGNGITLKNLLDYLKELIKPEWIDLNYREFRKGDIKISAADISMATDNLGFIPATPIEEGLRFSIDYYRTELQKCGIIEPGSIKSSSAHYGKDDVPNVSF
jgi:UDP-N-acetylglucosamine/UDP-N-acetylgalactosamine 4-epimerase